MGAGGDGGGVGGGPSEGKGFEGGKGEMAKGRVGMRACSRRGGKWEGWWEGRKSACMHVCIVGKVELGWERLGNLWYLLDICVFA